MQTNRWLHLSSGLWGISLGNFPLLWQVQTKNRPEEFPFIATNNWIVLAVRQSANYALLWIPQYSRKNWQKKKKWLFQSVLFYKQMQKTENKSIINHFGSFTHILNTHSIFEAMFLLTQKEMKPLYQTVSDKITFSFILFFCHLTG